MKHNAIARGIQILVVGLLMLGVAFAQGMPKKGEMGRKAPGAGNLRMEAQFHERLGIDKETSLKIREIRRNEQKQIIRVEAEKKIAQMTLDEMLTDTKATEVEIRKAADNLNKLQEKEASIKLDSLLAIRKNLTPEQFEKLVKAGEMMKRNSQRNMANSHKRIPQGKNNRQPGN